MQLTKLDRWLKERFIYETHIFTLRLPEEKLPKGVRVQEVDSKRAGNYNHKLIIKDNDLADYVITMLKNNHLMYATHVIEGKHWYNQRIAPEGKSFTFVWFTRFLTFVALCFVVWGGYIISQNETVVFEIKAAIEELKTGL